MGRSWVNASQGESMKRLPFVVCLSLLLTTPILAQSDAPRVEVFGGYAHNIGNAHGWNASAALNANRWFGVVADFGGLTAKETEPDIEGEIKAYTYLFGPQFSYRGNKWVTPFGRVLLGAVNVRATANSVNQSLEASDTSFSYGAGFGLDVRVNRFVAIRVLQADYIHTRFLEEGQHNGRFSFGIVLRFVGN